MSDTSAQRDQSRDNAISVAAISSDRIEPDDNAWTRRLLFFLRIMGVVSIAKGLSRSAPPAAFGGGDGEALERHTWCSLCPTVAVSRSYLVAPTCPSCSS